MFSRFLILILLYSTCFSEVLAGDITVTIPEEEYDAFRNQKNGGGKGCFETMLQGVSEGMAATMEAKAQETNTLIGLSQKYFENEQECGNRLSDVIMELQNAQAEHEEKLMTLPAKIKLQKIEHEEAINKIKKECRLTTGEVFRKWSLAVSHGVEKDPTQLMGKTRAKNGYRKLFYEDCIASEETMDEAETLAKKLSVNIELLQASIDASAMKLSKLSQQLSFKQGVIADNCLKAEKLLDYQSKLAGDMASATRSHNNANSFLRMLSGANVCLGGPSNSLDVTGSQSKSGVTK